MGGGGELVGRERELAVLETWLQRPAGSRVIFIYGERGVGKTAIWRRGSQLAESGAYRVMVSRPARAEAGMRFAALGDILQGVGEEDLEALAAPQRSALGAVQMGVSQQAGVGGAADIRPVSLGVLTLLKRLTAERPAVIAIDGTQWLDEGTTEVFQFAFRRLAAEPVLVLATYDTGVFGLEREAQLPLEDVEERVVSLPLPPLSDDDISRILYRRRLEGWPPSLVREASRLAGGNPRLALDLIPQPGADGQDDRLALPGTLTRWVLARLSGVPEAAMETLQAAAWLRDPAVDVLERVVGPRAARLDEAAQTGLVEVVDGRVRYLRPAVAAALRQSLDAEARRSLHRRLTTAVPESVERLRHLALATAHPLNRLARTLEDASREVGRGGDIERGCELAELSIRLTEPANKETLAHRRQLMGEWRLALGDSQVAAKTFADLAERLPPGRPERARLQRRLAWIELWMKGVTDSERRLERAITEVAADTTLSALLRCDLSYIRFLQGDLGGAAAHSARALELSTQPDVIRRARSLLAAIGAAAGQAAWSEERGLEQPGPDPTESWDEWQWIDLAVRGRVSSDEPSLPQAARSRSVVTEAGGPQWLAWLAEAQQWQELWGEAATVADRGLALAGETGRWVAAIRLRYVTALIAAHRGRVEQARAAAQEGLDAAERAGLAPLVALNSAVIGYIEHEKGSAVAAVEAFEPLLGVELPGPEPGLLRLFPNAVEALVDAGRVDRARDHLGRLDECRATLNVRWLAASAARCHGLVAAAAGRLDEAETWLGQAIETERVAARRLELGRHLLAVGVVRRRRRNRDNAADALERARTIFTALGADVWRARTVAEIQRLSPRRRMPAAQALTPTQEQVAELVAQGNSNKQVAAVLSLSVYTVESHLKVIFRKLGVQSRAALAFRLVESRNRGGDSD